jgi:hypothetical protein
MPTKWEILSTLLVSPASAQCDVTTLLNAAGRMHAWCKDTPETVKNSNPQSSGVHALLDLVRAKTGSDIHTAKQLGLHNSNPSVWRKQNYVPFKHIVKIAKIAGIPVDEARHMAGFTQEGME